VTIYLPDGSVHTPREGMAQAQAKASTGAGVGFYSAGHAPLSSMERTPQAMMKRAQLAYHVNPWVGTAESVVTRKVVGLPWHLEDGEDEEYEDDAPPEVQAAKLLIERPQYVLPDAKAYSSTNSKRLMWSLTSRHIGLCGMSHWYGDQMDLAGIPVAWIYVNPARMWSETDDRGNLTGWMLDATGTDGKGQPYGGLHFDLREILTFYLDAPDHGHYGSGIYERGIVKAQLTGLADQHAGYVLGTGGRIAGIVSPKEGSIPDEKFKTLVSEFRNVNEAPDAAKRTTIMQGPTDFTPTAANPSELRLDELAKMTKEDIFTIWGVPGSQAPVAMAAGLNSGETKGYDEAILMQGAVHDRVQAIRETLQLGWLDLYKPLVIELEIEEPEFDDESPAYERVAKSKDIALTNAERRDIIGLPPTGDDAIDNAILLPSLVTVWATAPGEGQKQGVIEPEPEPVAPVAPVVVDAAPEGKASARKEFLGLRRTIDQRTVPAVRTSVTGVLAEQRAHITAQVRAKGAHLAKKPSDTTVRSNEATEDARLTAALRPHLAGVASTVTKRAKEVLDRPAKAEFEDRVAAELLKSVGIRIAGINKHTRDAIAEAIREGFADGLSIAEVADLIEQSTLFSEVRAETIARTETMFAYNAAAIDSYREFGVEQVQALDGDDDEVCAQRDGQVYALADAMDIEDHPNGTLDWMPYFGKAVTPLTTPPPDILPPVAAPLPDFAALIAQAVEAGSGGWRAEVERIEATVKALLDHAMTPQPEAVPPVFNITMPEMTMPPVNMTISEGAIAPVFNMPPQRATRVLRDAKNQIIGSEPVDGE
jgi:hypothetical protein